MLYNLISQLFEYKISVFQNSLFALLTSFLLVFISGKPYIKLLIKSKLFFQPIRTDGPQSHLKKQHIPSIGGLLFLSSFWISSYLWLSELNPIITIIFLVSCSYALIGLIDDLLKLIFKNTHGLKGSIRLIIEFIIAFYAIYKLIPYYPADISHSIFIPYMQNIFIDVGVLILLFSSLAIVGTANSINLADGLDSMATNIGIIILIALSIIASNIISNNDIMSFDYGSLIYYNYIIQLLPLIASLVGALIGFKWFNAYPASIFMGDTGSLGLGGTIGIITVALKQELFLVLAGLFLVLTSLSVILQVYYYKFTKRRLFKMAPLHHHYEQLGYPESLITSRVIIFTIITTTLALLLNIT